MAVVPEGALFLSETTDVRAAAPHRWDDRGVPDL